MQASKLSRKFEATPEEISQAIDSIVSKHKEMTLSWSGDRKKAAILIDKSVWYLKNFKGKSIVFEFGENRTVHGECVDISLFSLFKKASATTLELLFNEIENNIKQQPAN